MARLAYSANGVYVDVFEQALTLQIAVDHDTERPGNQRMVYMAANYWDRLARIYDHIQRNVDLQPCVEVLASIAGGGAALELGVGTGRVALPLTARGCRVSGIDMSEQMLDKLREKEGADRLVITRGNFADVQDDGRYDLIYAVNWSFNYLLTQAEQIRCFCNARRALTRDGALVIETFVPGNWIFEKRGALGMSGEAVADSVMLHVSHTDLARQLVQFHYAVISDEKTEVYHERLRLVWPPEFDLLAHIAGLSLEARWGNWMKDPFTANSETQIAVYRPRT